MHDVEKALSATFDIARDYVRREGDAPVTPAHSPEALRDELEIVIDGKPVSPEHLDALMRRVLETTPSTGSTRFSNQLFSGRNVPATMAEILSVLMNVSTYTYKVAGPHVLIEAELIRKLSQLVGYDTERDEGDGIFVPGGSMANLAAMMIARNEARPGTRENGLDGSRLTVYASEDVHYSVPKAAQILGLGRRSVRRVPTDENGCMDPQALADMIDRDVVDRYKPIMVVATAGTTVQGAFDPIEPIARVAEEREIWLHVDAAFGGATLLHPNHRYRLQGCERAHSVTWDAHKMMGMPLLCSAVLIRERGLLHEHLNESASYLFQADNDELNLGTRSLQCGRRNDAFKLWAAWKALGDDGWQARLEKQLALASHAQQIVERDPEMVLSTKAQGINICFEVRDRSSEQICHALDVAGTQKVGWGVVKGRRVIRYVTVNPDMAFDDVERFFDDVRRVAATLESGDNDANLAPLTIRSSQSEKPRSSTSKHATE